MARRNEYFKTYYSICKAVQKDSALPQGLSKPLRLFLDSENGRGLWKWIFERACPTTITCVDKEALDGATAYRFLLTANAGLMYRLTAIVDQKGGVTQLYWW